MEPTDHRSIGKNKQPAHTGHSPTNKSSKRLFKAPALTDVTANDTHTDLPAAHSDASDHLVHLDTQEVPAETPTQARTAPDTEEFQPKNFANPFAFTPRPQTESLAPKLLEPSTDQHPLAELSTAEVPSIPPVTTSSVAPANSQQLSGAQHHLAAFETQMLPAMPHAAAMTHTPHPLSPPHQSPMLRRGQAFLLMTLLVILLLHALNVGPAAFNGSQGWAYALAGPPVSNANKNFLKSVGQQLNSHIHTTTSAHATLTPDQYVDQVISKMTLAQKLGQLMLVQFYGSSYSSDLSEMISQQNVGAVLIFQSNNNIVSKSQLSGLTAQMQQNSAIPLALSIDQEGGQVDRLANLDGLRPAASDIGLTNDPSQATAAGVQDAKDLSSYGLNLNLAPVVDVDTLSSSILHVEGRTYGNNPDTVTRMASAYLQGLQQSGKVLGTLKHFPGLGHVYGDPHTSITKQYLSKETLEQVDWAPYRSLIQQHQVHAIMVTHEFLTAIDPSKPSSLSPKVVQGILRDEFGFQGVIVTDSLTMQGITNLYTEGQAAALAIEAGSDLLMGASGPADVQNMIAGLQDALNSGALTQQRIDLSVHRILMLKYTMGLISVPKN